ncbi:MAG: peptidyl-prolyl cis-trans isomerase [Flavobacteriaceae bacterium]|jgi:hypothetical protein|nr:peptidyl-prolyl cis-trans isomerase [Flavobacteriaceae bacterium]
MKQSDDRKAAARVFDIVLYEEDMLKILPKGLNPEDSALFVKTYINRWAQEQLMLQKAKINLREDEEEINELVDQYKQDLLINRYKEAIVAQELDTLITSEDIEEFYNANKDIFKLNEELVKIRYIQYGNNVINPKEFAKLFKADDNEDDQKLMEQELQLKSYNLNDSIWIRYDDVMKHISFLKDDNKDKYLRKNYAFEQEEDESTYLVKVKDVLLRNEIAPMSYTIPTIKQMILHKRKLELIRKIEETLTNDAIKNKELQIY